VSAAALSKVEREFESAKLRAKGRRAGETYTEESEVVTTRSVGRERESGVSFVKTRAKSSCENGKLTGKTGETLGDVDGLSSLVDLDVLDLVVGDEST